MLVGIEGGARHAAVRDLLASYAAVRLSPRVKGGRAGATDPAQDAALLAAVLEICERFFEAIGTVDDPRGAPCDAHADADAAAAADDDAKPPPRGRSRPRSRARSPRRVSGGDPSVPTVPAHRFVHGLAGCYSLFPYQCLAGSRLIDAFSLEVPLLASWAVRSGFDGGGGRAPFTRVERAGSELIARHAALQNACEKALSRLPERAGSGRTIVDGRFRLERMSGSAAPFLAASVPGESSYGPLLLPAAATEHFVAGHDVCLALVETTAGWLPASSNLPIDPDELDRLARRWLSSGSRGGAGPEALDLRTTVDGSTTAAQGSGDASREPPFHPPIDDPLDS